MAQSEKNPAQNSATASGDDRALGVAVLEGRNLRKVYGTKGNALTVLADASIALQNSEMVAIVAPSGAGKSTLLHLLAALDTPTSGAIYFESKAIETDNEAALANFRNCAVGFLWQRHQLLPDFTAAENVAMPLLLRGQTWQQAEPEASRWLREVGLEQRAHHRSGELSGGEQQRVALARALVTGPKLLLADEPTGDLDGQTAEAVFALIARLHREHQLTSLIATHNLTFARRCHRVLRLQRGRVEEIAPESLPA